MRRNQEHKFERSLAAGEDWHALTPNSAVNRLCLSPQEPSPFSHVSGMKNRFECLIKGLRAAGDEVMVFTPDRTPPAEYHGARVGRVLGKVAASSMHEVLGGVLVHTLPITLQQHAVGQLPTKAAQCVQVFSILGFKLPHYPAPTLLLSCGLSIRVLWHLIMTRPHIIHASSPGLAQGLRTPLHCQIPVREFLARYARQLQAQGGT